MGSLRGRGRRRFKNTNKKLFVFLLLFAFWGSIGQETCAKRVEAEPYPQELRVSMLEQTWVSPGGASVIVDVPQTCNANVDEALYQALEELWEKAVEQESANHEIILESTYRVSGESWVGFLLMVRVVECSRSEYDAYAIEETRWMDYRMLTYDMKDGSVLTLGDVFFEDSMAWGTIAQAAQKELYAYYPSEAHDAQQIASLTAIETLRSLPFLPGAGRLVITFPLMEVVAGKQQLVQLSLFYPNYRQDMTPEAYRQTDNSARPIIALTYDDGPVLHNTRTLLRNLDRYGASATFFCVGTKLWRWADAARRELDHGHTVGSHTMRHEYAEDVSVDYLRQDREKVFALHRSSIGPEPYLFRPPGGTYKRYKRNEIGWPLIKWSLSAADSGKNTQSELVRRVTGNAKDGSIILMHDTYSKTVKAAEAYLDYWVEHGFMFATVEELLALHGHVPQPNVLYSDGFGPYVEEAN